MGRTVIDSPNELKLPLPDRIPLDNGRLTEKTAALLLNTLREVIRKLNRGISLGNGVLSYRTGNTDGQNIELVTPAPAGTEFRVDHGLNRVVKITYVGYKDQACDVYASRPESWGINHCYFKATAASARVTLQLF